MKPTATLLFSLLFVLSAHGADPVTAGVDPATVDDREPIPFLERYKPSYFLLGHPITKVQVSFRVQLVRDLPVHFGYTQLMMWDLFKSSAPFRDLNYNPDLFYRLALSRDDGRSLVLDKSEIE